MYLGIGLGITRLSGVFGFNPASLFANGEEGAWYDPSDLTTLYQDTKGQTPAGIGDPVGLMLDKSKGLTLGSELVTNGTFDSSTTGWTATACSISVVSGALRITDADGGIGYVTQAVTLVAGKTYRLSADIVTDAITGTMFVNMGTTDGSGQMLSLSQASGTGSVSGIFVATATTGYLNFRNTSAVAGEYWDVDNVSVRELPGNHATQSVSTRRPTLQSAGGLYYLDFNGVDDQIGDYFSSPLAQPITLALGYKLDVSGSTQFIVDSFAANTARMIFLESSGTLQYFAGSTVSTGLSDTNDNVAFLQYNTTDSLSRINGVQITSSANVGTNTWEYIRIGCSYASSAFMDGRIYGVVVVDRTLTAGEIDGVESYLAAKSGVTL